MLRKLWQKVSRVDSASSAGFFVAVVLAMGFVTLVALLLTLLGAGPIPLALTAMGWAVSLLVALLHATALDRGARLFTAKGASTPYVPQHSNLEALVAKGAYREAADAYRAVITEHPEDVVACEQLGRLALRELRDYELALFAAREGERRAPDARRRAGFALLAAGIYRDNLKDYGRTLVELRRVLATYPGVPNARRLRTEIEELKAMHFEAR